MVSLPGIGSLGDTGCSHVLIWVMVTSVKATERTLPGERTKLRASFTLL